MNAPPEEARESLWALIPGPLIWAVHFLLSYVTAAIWCAKIAGSQDDIDPARIAIGLYTLAALVLIALSARHGFRRHSYGESAGPPHDEDTADDRHRFLGFASLLLCGLAALAVLYTALAAVIVRSCS